MASSLCSQIAPRAGAIVRPVGQSPLGLDVAVHRQSEKLDFLVLTSDPEDGVHRQSDKLVLIPPRDLDVAVYRQSGMVVFPVLQCDLTMAFAHRRTACHSQIFPTMHQPHRLGAMDVSHPENDSAHHRPESVVVQCDRICCFVIFHFPQGSRAC